MSRWFRFYNETLDDPKVQQLSDTIYRRRDDLLCIACRNHGRIPGDMKALSFMIRQTVAKTRAAVQALLAAGLLERVGQDYKPHGWEKRQYSDPSAERMRRHRDKTRTVTSDGDGDGKGDGESDGAVTVKVTGANVTCDDSESDTDSDTDSDRVAESLVAYTKNQNPESQESDSLPRDPQAKISNGNFGLRDPGDATRGGPADEQLAVNRQAAWFNAACAEVRRRMPQAEAETLIAAALDGTAEAKIAIEKLWRSRKRGAA